MEPKLTRKQKVFVDAVVETGNATAAAQLAYPDTTYGTQRVIASENLAKPNIMEAIASRITPEMVDEAHESLLGAVKLDYFVFGKHMSDEEIKEHVESVGLTCINIRPSEKGKLAFFSLPDGQARGKAIELYHKVHGTFAPEKKLTVHVEAQAIDPRIRELARKLNK